MSKYKKLNTNGEIVGVLDSVYGNTNVESITDGEFLRLRTMFMLMNGMKNPPAVLYHRDINEVKK